MPGYHPAVPTTPFVAMICGSRSDLPVLEEGAALLDELGVTREMRVISAHRAPALLDQYIDDATDTWFREVLGTFESSGFDFMVKKITIEWQSAARFGETLELDAEVTRWGNASFDVGIVGRVGDRRVVTATLVYVSTVPGQATARPVPDAVRTALGGA